MRAREFGGVDRATRGVPPALRTRSTSSTVGRCVVSRASDDSSWRLRSRAARSTLAISLFAVVRTVAADAYLRRQRRDPGEARAQ